MKKLVFSMIIAAGSLLYKSADAQVGVHVGFNLGPVSVHLAAPVASAPVYDDFYYLPDEEAYYSVPEHCYYYNDGDEWISAAYLPGRFHDIDWRSARRYEVRAQRPYMNHSFYRSKFGGFNGGYNRDMYANRMPDRRGDWNNRGGRFQDSPFDSNNAYGRGEQPRMERRGGGFQGQMNDNRGGWDGQRGDNNQGRGEMNRGNWNNQGGYNQRGNDYNQNGFSGQRNNQGGQSQGNFGGQPSNNNQNTNQGGNQNGRGERGGNWNGNGQEHFAQNNNSGSNNGNRRGF
ncbi:hypothetical protein HH214_20765 [Mucilaginibacter robiniae]|uniref:DUF3300 domain-containing protein n=1 Tax=Mucilaginibacter robiniae TaxID=2728022 RepID=A0A7L5EB12_9SPHI|nr:hypothetical protein [Mucilaginibacter robiniae]QJD98133.1 hypothetical protein HH214_20765 [Mucilaginibacter robiniae]